MKKIGILIAAIMISTLLMQFVWYVPDMQKTKEDISPEKINLALRRTGHLLLQQAGDSTSQIPPIEKVKENTWRLHLTQHFDYDSLPVFLQNSLNIHQIRCNYDVSVLNCADGTLVLGYNFWDISADKKVPCSGRKGDFLNMCYDIQFSILPQTKKDNHFPLMGWFTGALFAAILYYAGKKYLYPPEITTFQPEKKEEEKPIDKTLSFADSSLDVANLQLRCGNVQHKLTYREAKLLHLFVQQPNQVLERSFILDNVWADEGIVVGRSIDMFVSRLRKMLRDDPNVQLVAVHGVGYKLEIVST